jgi:hypothetical protein
MTTRIVAQIRMARKHATPILMLAVQLQVQHARVIPIVALGSFNVSKGSALPAFLHAMSCLLAKNAVLQLVVYRHALMAVLP